MATTASSWLMTEGQSLGRGYYQRDIVSDAPYGVVDGTQKRDVSEMLDILALAETPFINKIGWGAESGGTKIEWITEDLGSGKLKNLSTLPSEAASFIANSVDGMDASDTLAQIKQGSVLYYYCSISGNHTLAVVTSTPFSGGTGTSITLSLITAGHGASLLSMYSSVPVNRPWYVIGAFANEGSIPGKPGVRQRVICSNIFTILRQDVQITGTMKSTDMYAVGREDQHQIMLRLKELQRERERAALYSAKLAKTSAMAGLMDGVFGFLAGQSGTNIDTSTKTLTETAVNTMVSFIWEQGGRNLTFFGNIAQTGKFTDWDKNRIRMRPDDKMGGAYITSYMCKCGIELDLVPMPNVPTNLAFILDTSKIKMRAKKGRKAVMEQLGKMGDFDDWQIISEFSLEMKGYNLRQHGMFARLV
jgi:hypothetical protein